MSSAKLVALYTWMLLLLSVTVNAQHLTRIDYTQYTSWFSHTAHIPIVVEYTLRASAFTCYTKTERQKKFRADPEHGVPNLNKDYRNSGYDRGHNMSAADNSCNPESMKECFYFSNMTPQPHAFNAGKWEELEIKERQEALLRDYLIVTVGSIGKAGTIGEDSVVVPKFMWKVMYSPHQKTYECYLFPNSNHVNEPLQHYLVKLHEIEEKAQVHFKDGVVIVKEHL